MDTLVLRIFQHEVELQCRFILASVHELNATQVLRGQDDVWRQLQTILVSSANLSKMLWGSGTNKAERKAKEAERKPLRDSLQIEDGSPLRDRNLRNDFEHFDERVERWFGLSEHRNYMGRNIGPPNMVVGLETGDRFQHFDPTTCVVTFWDRSVSLSEIIAEVQRILPLAHAEASKPHWDQGA